MPIDPSTAFVSYSREDLEFALRLAQDLRANGAKVWLDSLDIELGQEWDRAVERALASSQRILVILSPAAAASSHVGAETTYAINEGKEVIPVLIHDCSIPFRLRRFQYADFRTDYAIGLAALLAVLTSDRAAPVGTTEQARAESERKQAEAAKTRLEQLERERTAAEEKARLEELERHRIAAGQGGLEAKRKHAMAPLKKRKSAARPIVEVAPSRRRPVARPIVEMAPERKKRPTRPVVEVAPPSNRRPPKPIVKAAKKAPLKQPKHEEPRVVEEKASPPKAARRRVLVELAPAKKRGGRRPLGIGEQTTNPSPRRVHRKAVPKAKAGRRTESETKKFEASSPPPVISVDNVHFTLTGPGVLAPGMAHQLIFWLHLEQQSSVVLKMASRAHGKPVTELSVDTEGPYPMARGSNITIALDIDGVTCRDNHKSMIWTGEIGRTSFVIMVPSRAHTGTLPSRALIRVNGCQIAKMSFVLSVGSPKEDISLVPSQTTFLRTAFASYASEDRLEVLSRIQGMEAAYKGLDVFMDVIDLRSGQDWEERLRGRIANSDVFYLFWCRHARKSRWVDKEWRWALQAKGLDFIDPIPLETPRLAPPPRELATKHFNDPLLAFMIAEGGSHS